MCRLLSLLDTPGMINVNENGQLGNSNLYTEKCSYYAIFLSWNRGVALSLGENTTSVACVVWMDDCYLNP